MIELQGDRYVRVNSTAADGEALPLQLPLNSIQSNNTQLSNPAPNHSTKRLASSTAPRSAPVIATASVTHDLPAAVLIFRDGHSQEVRDYAIADGFLYARGDFYKDGYWNKKIDLSTLDLAETLQANSARSVKFVLPSSPNEVITRP